MAGGGAEGALGVGRGGGVRGAGRRTLRVGVALSMLAAAAASAPVFAAAAEDETEAATDVMTEVAEQDPDPVFDEDLEAAGAGLEDEPDPLFDDSFDEDLEAAHESYPDPLESTNRGVLAFNRQVDKWILDPVTEAYQWAVPKPARNSISRFFLNLGSTKTLVNDCLQLEWKDAGVTTARLLMNSTVGVVGLFDVAESVGLPGHESDFGQTLALAGTPSGPYLMLPVLGPATLRDGFGSLVDGFFQPTYYILGPMTVTLGPVILQSPGAILIYGGSSGLTLRDRNFAKLKDLESSSVDYYAALRSGYYQDRVGQIWERRTHHRTTHEPAEEDGEDEPDAAAAEGDAP
ncbi:VacJ family lipoprotein [Myxococcota bacterium]|nr:VacJ family lipoprotein [Myxococcota bacterium]